MINELIKVKDSIKNAIIYKGGTITGGLNTYAQSIQQLQTSIVSTYVIPNGIKLGLSENIDLTKYDFSKVEDWSSMFSFSTIRKIPSSIFHNGITNIHGMCNGAQQLTFVGSIYCGNVASIAYAFRYCDNLVDFGGLIDFGKIAGYCDTTSAFDDCKNLSRQSCINIFNNLYDRKAAGYSVLTLQFEPEVVERLNAFDIAIATNKGWTVSS